MHSTPASDKPSFLELRLGYSKLIDNDLVSLGELTARNGFQFGLQGAYFFNKYLGLGAEFGFSSFPVNHDAFSFDNAEVNEISNGYYVQPIGIRFLHIGPYVSLPLRNNWFITSKFTAGVSVAAQGDIQLSLTDEYAELIGNTEFPFVKYKPGNAPSWATGISVKKRIGRNTAINAYADYFHSRHTMEIDGVTEIGSDGKITYAAMDSERIRYSNLGLGLGLTVFLW